MDLIFFLPKLKNFLLLEEKLGVLGIQTITKQAFIHKHRAILKSCRRKLKSNSLRRNKLNISLDFLVDWGGLGFLIWLSFFRGTTSFLPWVDLLVFVIGFLFLGLLFWGRLFSRRQKLLEEGFLSYKNYLKDLLEEILENEIKKQELERSKEKEELLILNSYLEELKKI